MNSQHQSKIIVLKTFEKINLIGRFFAHFTTPKSSFWIIEPPKNSFLVIK